MDGHYLVASDGSAGSLGALRVARSLARRRVSSVTVLAVLEEMALYEAVAPVPVVAGQLELEARGSQRLREVVQAQVDGLGEETADWNIVVEVGSPAAVIADLARENGIALILLGLGRHAAAERWLGRETALRVMQLADVPVLAVHPDAHGLPGRALVAEDFSDFSREAGIWALDLLEENGELHLAHAIRVPSSAYTEGFTNGWLDSYLDGIRARLEARAKELAAVGKGRILLHTLQGEPGSELLRLAEKIDADLIAAGRHGRGFVERLLIGSVSTRLVRRAHRSALIVPGRLPARGADAP